MMRLKKLYLLPIILLILFLIIIGIYYLVVRSNKAALVIETQPASEVLIDNEKIGKTPFEGEFENKEIIIKLIPESFDTPLIPYETKVKVVAGVTTIVRREFSEEEEGDSGEEISFEKLGRSETAASVVSKPDGAKVYIDNEFIDLAPAKTDKLSPGEHEVVVKADGYLEKKFKISNVLGYGITAIVELAVNNEIIEVKDEMIEVNEENDEVMKIKILDTSTGFLRVREGASINDKEVGRVEPKDEFEVLEKDATEKWYKIEYEEGKNGWVSGEFVEVIE